MPALGSPTPPRALARNGESRPLQRGGARAADRHLCVRCPPVGRSGAGRCGAVSRAATLRFFSLLLFFLSSSFSFPFPVFSFFLLFSFPFFSFPLPPPPPFFSSIKTMAPSPLKPSLHHHLKQVTTPSFLLAGHLLSQNTKPYLPRGTLR